MPLANTIPPILRTLPEPPPEINQHYMQQLVAAVTEVLRELNEMRYLRASGIYAPNLPTSSAGLRTGELYRDGSVVRVAGHVDIGLSGQGIGAGQGSVTV